MSSSSHYRREERKRSRDESSSPSPRRDRHRSPEYDRRPSRSQRTDRDRYDRDNDRSSSRSSSRPHSYHDMADDFHEKLFLKNVNIDTSEREIMDYLNYQMKEQGLVHFGGDPVVDCEKRHRLSVASIMLRDPDEAKRLLSLNRKLRLGHKPLVIERFRKGPSKQPSSRVARPEAAQPKMELKSPPRRQSSSQSAPAEEESPAPAKSPPPTASTENSPNKSSFKRSESESTTSSDPPPPAVPQDEEPPPSSQDDDEQGTAGKPEASTTPANTGLDPKVSQSPSSEDSKKVSKFEEGKYLITTTDACIELLQKQLDDERRQKEALEKRCDDLVETLKTTSKESRSLAEKNDERLNDVIAEKDEERKKRRQAEKDLKEAKERHEKFIKEATDKYNHYQEQVRVGKADYEQQIAKLKEDKQKLEADLQKTQKQWLQDKKRHREELASAKNEIVILDDRSHI